MTRSRKQIRETRSRSAALLRERSEMFDIRGYCNSNGRCKLCEEATRDLLILSKHVSASGEEFVLKTDTELKVCLRCSSVHGEVKKLTGVATADMPLDDFLDAAVAHSVLGS